jgi:hypothetical protein
MKNNNVQLFCLLVGLTVSLVSADEALMIQEPENDNLVARPRQVITAVFRVTNLFESEDEFLEELHLPEGWKMITSLIPFQIAPAATQVRMVSFLVPSDAMAGDYEIIYSVRSRKYPHISDFKTLNIRVYEVRKIQLLFLNVPDLVMAGESFDVRLLITNASNVTDTILVDPGAIHPFQYKISKSQYILKPKQSDECHIQCSANPNLTQQMNGVLQMTAFSKRQSDNRAVISRIIDLVPLQARKPDLYHRLPVSATLRTVWQNHPDRQGTQIDITGSGSLDEQGKQLLKYRIRTPDQYETSVLGEYSEYYVILENQTWTLGLGDQHFSLSPLLEYSIYSRGLQLKYRNARYSVGGYLHQTRFRFQKEKQAAVYVQVPLKEHHQFQLSYLIKEHRLNQQNKTSAIMSLQYSTVLKKTQRLTLEYASSLDKYHGDAFNVSMLGKIRNLDYQFQTVHADDHFYGYYTNRSMITGMVRYKMHPKVQLLTRINQNENRFYTESALIKIFGSYRDAGLKYGINEHLSLTSAYGRREQRDEQTVSRFSYRDDMGILQLACQYQRISFSTRFEHGWTRNQMSDTKSMMNRFSMSARYQPIPQQSYQLYLMFDKSGYNSLYDNQYINVGFNAKVLFWQRLDLVLNLQNYLTPEGYYNGQNTVHTQLNYRLNYKNSVSLQLRRTLRRNEIQASETAILAQYQYRFDMPVRRKKTVGYIKGTIQDQHSMQPVPGAIVRINGFYEVTDEAGRFAFRGLTPGAYYLDLDRAQIGLDKVCTRKMPMIIEVQPGAVMDFDFQIVKSAKIQGKVILYKIVNDTSDHFSAAKMKEHLDEYYLSGIQIRERKSITNSKTILVPDTALSNIVIRLERDDETLRRLTDRQGEFSFDDLRPGKWKLVVDDSNLPAYNQVEFNEIQFDLKPGDSEKQLIRILPRRRKIQFLDKNESIIQEKPRLFTD